MSSNSNHCLLQAGKAFTEWQKYNQICYFPYQKNLTYFDSYSQDNCLLECRIKKISKRCRCAPWFIPRSKNTTKRDGHDDEKDDIKNLPVCNAEGIKCVQNKLKTYNEDLEDRMICDCKNDCEMVHTFSTLQVRLQKRQRIYLICQSNTCPFSDVIIYELLFIW